MAPSTPPQWRSPWRRAFFWAALAAITLAWTAPAFAANDPSKLVYRFDFEEQKLGNYEDLPMHWHVIGRQPRTTNPNFMRMPLHVEMVNRPGFPTYTEVRFDTRQYVSGEHSLYLGLNGGSAGAFLEVGSIPVLPGADYLVTACVRTSMLDRARARVLAYFIEDQGNRIENSTDTTTPVKTGDKWVNVSER